MAFSTGCSPEQDIRAGLRARAEVNKIECVNRISRPNSHNLIPQSRFEDFCGKGYRDLKEGRAMTEDDRMACYTPTAGRDGATRIPRWKYDCVRRAILDVLEDVDSGEIRFQDLAGCVQDQLSSNQLAKLGSLKWHVTTVKLNMEVDGELERVPRKTPQMLRKPIE